MKRNVGKRNSDVMTIIREMSEWVEYITFDGVSPICEIKANGHETRSKKIVTLVSEVAEDAVEI